MHVEQLSVDLATATDPFSVLFDALVPMGADPQTVAWLLPRLDQAINLRGALARLRAASGDAAEFTVSPVIITADRLSDHAASPAWLELRLAAHEALKAAPTLTRQARSAAERWQLADEYLQLAHACVSAGEAAAASLGQVMEDNPLAGPEAGIVLTLARLYREELLALQAPAPSHPAWPQVQTVVWLDDGEPLARRWLQRHGSDRRIVRADLLAGLDAQGDPPTPLHRVHQPAELLQAAESDTAAHMAAQRILQWLQEDSQQTVAVAVVDRLLARRVRSLLEGADVAVDDRTGWRLSTTRLAGWLDCLLRGWLTQDWPVWLAALEPHWLPLAGGAIEHALLPRWAGRMERDPLHMDWERLQAEARSQSNQWPNEADRDRVTRLLGAFERWGREPRSLSDWAHGLLELLTSLQSLSVLQADEAGVALLSQLRTLARSSLTTVCDAELFMQVLSGQLEAGRFRPEDATSPVRFMPLQSFRLQRWPRVLVLGVARRHFMPSPPGLLPPSVATELGLADPWLTRSQSLAALAEILHGQQPCVLVHPLQSEGKPEPLVGWLRAAGLQLQRSGMPDWLRQAQVCQRQTPRREERPLTASAGSLPEELTVGAVSDLAGCPLKFALTHVAGLRDWQPGVMDERINVLRGLFVHDVLERLWKNHLSPSAKAGSPMPQGDGSGASDQLQRPQAWQALLDSALASAWQALSPTVRRALYQDRLDLERGLPGLALKLAERHRDGWRVVAQEYPVETVLQVDDAWSPLKLRGRLDRLEQRGEVHCIVDVKTAQPEKLRKRAAQWPDHPQLPLYARMLGQACQALSYLSVRGDEPEFIALKGASPDEMADTVVDRLTAALAHLYVQSGTAMPLPGSECDYCSHAGACRNGWWQAAGAATEVSQ